MSINILKKLSLLSLLVLFCNGFIGYGVYNTGQKLKMSQMWVQHTKMVIDQASTVNTLATDMETASLGFIIIGDSALLKPLWTANRNILSSILVLQQLTYDNPIQQKDISPLTTYLSQLSVYSSANLQLRNSTAPILVTAYTPAIQFMICADSIHQITERIKNVELQLLKQRTVAADKDEKRLNIFSITMYGLLIVFTLLLLVVTGSYLTQGKQKAARAADLVIANKELAYQNKEKEKRKAELIIANNELLYQNSEKEKRAAELIVANAELLFQNNEKEKRAGELAIANRELVFQNNEKGKRAAELIVANKELEYQNKEKGKRAAELAVANAELLFQNKEKEKRSSELDIANRELTFQNREKGNRAAELVLANYELEFQNSEKEKRSAELDVANHELLFQNEEKEKRAAELAVANEELLFQSNEKGKRAAELVVANEELLGSQEMARYGNFKFDYKTGIYYWSEQLCRIFGLDIEENELPYGSFISAIHPEDLKNVMEVTNRSKTGTSNVNFYHRIITPDNVTKHVHTWQRTEFDDSGQPTSLHIVVHDVTEQTVNISQLKAQNKQLREIAWVQSHKVRGPLATILGLAQLFHEKEISVNNEIIIQGILDSSEELDNVIREIVNNTDASDISYISPPAI